jgi:hypothetical protein
MPLNVKIAQVYPPDGPDIPTITLNESQEGAAGLPPLEVPRPPPVREPLPPLRHCAPPRVGRRRG